MGNAKGAVAVEEGAWPLLDEQLQELVLVEAQVHRLVLEMWQAFFLEWRNLQFCLIKGIERARRQVVAA